MSTPAITWTSAAASSRNNYTGGVGFRFTVGANHLSVTDLGRLRLAGNSGTHTIHITDQYGTNILTSAAIDMSTGTAESFNYVSITPIILTAGQEYWLYSDEASGGDTWYDSAVHNWTISSDITINGGCYDSGPNSGAGNGGTGGGSYVIPNFKYDIVSSGKLVTHDRGVPFSSAYSITSSLNTTGADLLVIHYVGGTTSPTITDSKGNDANWIGLTAKTQTGVTSRIYYVTNPTVGTGHTFTVTATANFPSFEVFAFSGMDTTSPFLSESGAVKNGIGANTVQQDASVTPSATGDVTVTGLWWSYSAGTPVPSIDSSFNRLDFIRTNSGYNYGSVAAYITGTTSALQPTWSANENYLATTIAVFKAASGGGSPTVKNLAALGVG